MATYDGTTGRIVGGAWGSIWFALGTGLGIMVLDMVDALPPFVEGVVADVLPGLLRSPAQTPDGLTGPAVAGLFATVAFVYGGYELGKVLFQSDYSITFTSGTP